MTTADVLFRVRLDVTQIRLTRRATARARSRAGRQRALRRYIRKFRRRWRARTVCGTEYRIKECSRVVPVAAPPS